MMMEKLAERLAGETEVLGENLLQCRFVHHKPHMLPGFEPGAPRWEASDKPLELRHGIGIDLPFYLFPFTSILSKACNKMKSCWVPVTSTESESCNYTGII
jgi:hypothetical protein